MKASLDQHRLLVAEALGTFLLTATVVGSGIMAQNLTSDIGLQLTINTLATVLILFLLISMLGPISGAHFNPAVSLVFLLTKGITRGLFVFYVLAQLIGGFLGAVIANLMFEVPTQISINQRISSVAAVSEVVATAGLVLTILLLLRYREHLVPVGVAAWIGAGYFFTSSTSFANPAVTFGRVFSDTFTGIEPVSASWFIAIQLVSAVLGLFIYKYLEGEK